MSFMAEKKRKRSSDHHDETVHKKIAKEPSDVVKISIVSDESEWAPILGV